MNLTSAVLSGSVLIIISIFLFLLLRQINLWYWKTDERVSLLSSQADSLRVIAEQSQKQTELLFVILSTNIDGKTIALTDRSNGGIKFVAPSDLNNYSLNHYDVSLLSSKSIAI